MQPWQEMRGDTLVTVHPSFVEQMAYYHHERITAVAEGPWEQLPADRRKMLVKVMGEIVDRVLDTCDD